jgi:RND family efflux transporter MFP subunit
MFTAAFAAVAATAIALHTLPGPSSGPGRTGGSVPLDVETVMPRRKPLTRVVEKSVFLQPRARRELYAKVSGFVKWVARDGDLPGRHFLGKGSWVQKGDVLVEIDTPRRRLELKKKASLLSTRELELQEARTRVLTAKHLQELARSRVRQAQVVIKRNQDLCRTAKAVLARDTRLAKKDVISKDRLLQSQLEYAKALAGLASSLIGKTQALEELEARSSELETARAHVRVKAQQVRGARTEFRHAKARFQDARVCAPCSGVIEERYVGPGDFVPNARSGRARPVLTLMDVRSFKVFLQLTLPEAARMTQCLRAVVRVGEAGSWEGLGQVTHIAPDLDPRTHTLGVEVALPNGDGRLRVGMLAHVTLTLGTPTPAWTIPAGAVVRRAGRSYVMVVQGGRARRLPVRVRINGGKVVEVVKVTRGGEVPLAAGEEIIIGNPAAVREGQSVRGSRRG